jgi:hypothetical protein
LFIESKSVGGYLQFEVLKVELDPECMGNFKIFTGAPILNHQTSIFSNLAQRATIIVQGFEFEALMVVLDPTA